MTVSGLTLLLGGARSGKSDLAVEIAKRSDLGVTFVATAEALDADMMERIHRHQFERPAWPTIDAPLALDDALTAAERDHLVIVDCLTLWVANMMFANLTDEAIAQAATTAAHNARNRTAPTVVVTNEVGLGIHPENDLGRRYRDQLGRVNRIWAGQAHRSLFVVAGRAVALHDPWEYLS